MGVGSIQSNSLTIATLSCGRGSGHIVPEISSLLGVFCSVAFYFAAVAETCLAGSNTVTSCPMRVNTCIFSTAMIGFLCQPLFFLDTSGFGSSVVSFEHYR